jgi:hypothetical protein
LDKAGLVPATGGDYDWLGDECCKLLDLEKQHSIWVQLLLSGDWSEGQVAFYVHHSTTHSSASTNHLIWLVWGTLQGVTITHNDAPALRTSVPGEYDSGYVATKQ